MESFKDLLSESKYKDMSRTKRVELYFTDGRKDYQVELVKKNGRWHEESADPKLDEFGGMSYGSYLNAQDLVTWLQQDYEELDRFTGMWVE